jgi:hypothetical protein
MRGWGITFLILGVGSILLPMIGMQFCLMSFFGDATPIVGGILAVVGLVMVIVSYLPGNRPPEPPPDDGA